MKHHALKTLSFAAAIFVAVVAFSASAYAGSLRQGSTGSSGAVTGSLPGQVLWTYYQTFQEGFLCPPDNNTFFDELCNTESLNDNIIRLVNPNGAANANLAGAKTQTVCAMIYVFDDDEEMGECCGCPLSSTQLATFSVDSNLNSNWGLNQGTEFNGAIAIVASAPNTVGVPFGSFGSSFVNTGGGGSAGQCLGTACCDPTNVPGYSVSATNNLLGSITHGQAVAQPSGSTEPLTVVSGITETPLSDDAGGDPTNLIYLQTQCGALVGNGSGGGVCNCPVE